MAREVYRFAVTIPPATPIATPQVSALAMPIRTVSRVEVRIPPGPRGTVGFQLGSGGLQMVPINAGQFVVTDDEKLGWDLTDQITSGAWQLIAFNLGTFAHTLEVVFLTDPVIEAPAPAFVPLSPSDLNSVLS